MSHQDVLHGNNLDLLAAVRDNFAHAVVTDPPYGLGFMGKDWDAALPDPRTWSECLRVLRPGGHLVAFGAPRLVHRLTCQIEDAGFEVRDCLLWVFGCLSEDTEILVNGEWVHYRKAMAGSLAMCYDIDDDTFSEQPIEKLFVYDYDDTAYRIQSDGTDQIVSRTHKCIVQRGGRWVFDTAESVAREQQARVPVLEDVRGLLSELSVHEQNASCPEQAVPGLREESDARPTQKEADERTLGHGGDSVHGVRHGGVAPEGVGVTRVRADLLPSMQRETAGGGAGQALAQGARGVDCGEPADLHGEDDRREQPGLEGWGHAQARQGELHRTEVREVPAGVSSNGSQGRLCDGASTGASEGDRPLLDAHRSGPPREPRQPGQPDREPDVVREQQGPQAVRASRFTASDLAAVTPIHYTGKVWCVKVPTGAFVARRNGKIFVTGNSGFPKSLDVSKAIDKQDAVEEQEARRLRFTAWLRSTGVTSKQIDDATGTNMGGHYTTAASQPAIMTREHLDACRHLFGQVPEWVEQEANIRTVESQNLNSREVIGTITKGSSPLPGNHKGTWVDGQVDGTFNITAPATPEAAKWSGWGTALKPAYEPIVLARKPLDGTVAQTAQRWGTGGLNIDGCRVGDEGGGVNCSNRDENGKCRGHKNAGQSTSGETFHGPAPTGPAGRWPANLILDEDAGAMLDAQSGVRRSAGDYPSDAERGSDNATSFGGRPGKPYADSGGASRFFKQADFGEADRFMYCPKASRSEREAGLDHLPTRVVDPSREEDAAARDNPRTGAGRSGEARRNHHATVKPIDLMRWLVRLVTPPGGMVLEPFAGSGTTPAACALEDVDCLAMELDADYVEIARARVAHAVQQREEELAAKIESSRQMDLFAMEACS